jgi:peptide/nickel transport system ATP-binding protein
MNVGEILREGMLALKVVRSEEEARERAAALLFQVGLKAEHARRYPHEFSGGQRQRIAIARALAVSPRVILCDEPTSALDVSVQAQILNLMQDLQTRLGVAYLFITHNFAVVEYLAHEIAVMYLGRIVESGPAAAVLAAPAHPYTRALLSAVPRIEGGREVIRLEGEAPSPANPPPGCHFCPRCKDAMPICKEAYPPLTALATGRKVACWLQKSAN